MTDETTIVQAAALVLVDAALRLLEEDPHQHSTRPCPTCQAVSAIVGRQFGCNRKRLEAQARKGER